MENSNNGGKGLGFVEVLGVVFIILKLCGVIDWPWVWVLAPIWGSLILFVVLAIIFVILWLLRRKKFFGL